MKRLVNALLFTFLVIGVSCSSNSEKENDGQEKAALSSSVKAATVSLIVEGMTCAGCENTIQSKLSAIKGVHSVDASYKTGKVVVLMNKEVLEGGKIPQLELAKAVESSGYTVESIEVVKNN